MEGPKIMAEDQYGVRFRETQIQILVSGTVVYENLYMGEWGNTRAESQKPQRYSLMNHRQGHVCGTPSQKTRTLPALKKPPLYFFPVVSRPLSSHLPKESHCHLP